MTHEPLDIEQEYMKAYLRQVDIGVKIALIQTSYAKAAYLGIVLGLLGVLIWMSI